MDFYCGTGFKRPVRLKDNTRQFAYESMHGKYGDMARSTPYVSVDDVKGFDEMNTGDQYDASIKAIAEKAPIRLIEGERIIGSATLGSAIDHMVPCARNGKLLFSSVSHLTVGFDRVLKIGMNGIDKDLDNYSDKPYTAHLKNVVEAFRIWHKRYLDASKDVNEECRKLLERVPLEPPTSFHEALQSLWFIFAFTRITGNWSGIGRIDEMLGGYLENDLEKGVLTLDEARELLAHFFIKGTEWIEKNTPLSSGDAQHYQNIVLGGIDRNGNEVTNEVTYLVLDVVEELGISDFPISVRISAKSPARLLDRTVEVIRYGGGIIAIYNEDLVLSSLESIGYDREEARTFANDGCWEVQIPGKTYFNYLAFDSFGILMKEVIGIGGEVKHYDTFEELRSAYHDAVDRKMAQMAEFNAGKWRGYYNENGEFVWNIYSEPAEVVSLFEEGCAANGRSYFSGGPKYSVISPHIGGAPDTGNCLHVIDKFCFKEKSVSYDELMKAVAANWEGYEDLRIKIRNTTVFYGNDDDNADSYVTDVLDSFADSVLKHVHDSPVIYIPGVSTFGRQVLWLPERTASPISREGDILSGNASPTPGTDTEGATAIIKSYCKADLKKQVNGAALDVRLHSSSVSGDNGLIALKALIEAFITLNGYFLQVDIVDTEALKEAQLHPEEYKTLSVRVSGWNARFVTLDEKWQKMVIERTEEGF